MQAATSPSLWLDPPPEPGPALDGEVDADVAVVGGGFTGLSAAIALASRAVSVVLEREVVGFGASGRNAGHLTPTIGKDLPTLARPFGRERARGLVALAETAIAHVEETIRAHAIDCAYEPVGNVMAAVHPRPARHARPCRAGRGRARARRRVTRARGDARAWAPGRIHARLPPPPRRHPPPRALCPRAPSGGARSGRRPARGHAGGRVHRRGAADRLCTSGGRVRARAVARHQRLHADLGLLRHAVLRLHVQLFATAPLGRAERAARRLARPRRHLHGARDARELPPDRRRPHRRRLALRRVRLSQSDPARRRRADVREARAGCFGRGSRSSPMPPSRAAGLARSRWRSTSFRASGALGRTTVSSTPSATPATAWRWRATSGPSSRGWCCAANRPGAAGAAAPHTPAARAAALAAGPGDHQGT